MIWILYVVTGIVALLILLSIAGSFLPKGHLVARSIELPVKQTDLWSVITDFANQGWRTGFTSAERKPDTNGKEVWLETASKYNQILLRTDEAQPPTRLVRTIADPKSPFIGSWTYELEPIPEGTRLTITERGEVKPPFFRLIGSLTNMTTSTIDRYQSDLARKVAR